MPGIIEFANIIADFSDRHFAFFDLLKIDVNCFFTTLQNSSTPWDDCDPRYLVWYFAISILSKHQKVFKIKEGQKMKWEKFIGKAYFGMLEVVMGIVILGAITLGSMGLLPSSIQQEV